MKIAASSASFARALALGETTQLEWLDLCANELEVDGVVFDAAHFPRTDDDYLAQLKKCAADLGLTVAAVSADDVLESDGARRLDVAVALGAPLLVTRAAPASKDAAAWGAFTEMLKARARDAKRVNVTLSLRNAAGTLCADAGDLARATKDVDSAWLRYAFDAREHELNPSLTAALGKTTIAVHVIENVARFATPGDAEATALTRALARFRGFVLLEATDPSPRDAFHRALERFSALRATQLASHDMAH